MRLAAFSAWMLMLAGSGLAAAQTSATLTPVTPAADKTGPQTSAPTTTAPTTAAPTPRRQPTSLIQLLANRWHTNQPPAALPPPSAFDVPPPPTAARDNSTTTAVAAKATSADSASMSLELGPPTGPTILPAVDGSAAPPSNPAPTSAAPAVTAPQPTRPAPSFFPHLALRRSKPTDSEFFTVPAPPSPSALSGPDVPPAGALPPPPAPGEPVPVPGALLPPPTPLPPEKPQPTPQGTLAIEPTLSYMDLPCAPADSHGRYWTTAEYLLWRTEHAPLTRSLETGAFPGVSGVVGGGATVYTFFGPSNMTYPNYSGVRLTTGLWLDPAEEWGAEASAFFVRSPGIQFKSLINAPTSISTIGVFPTIALYEQYISSTTGTPSALLLASQAGLTNGFLNVDSSSFLWGAEVNLVRNIYRDPTRRIQLIAGFRNVDLREDLNITSGTNAQAQTGFYVMDDRFATRNTFYGGQIGARAEWQHDAFRCGVNARVALGDTVEVLTVAGSTAFLGTAGGVNFPGGFYAQPSNSGRFTRDQFAAIPQVGVNLGYQAGRHCYFFMGYDFLYWTSVIRPGSQVNPVVDPNQVPVLSFGSTGAIPVTTSNPAPLFVARDFWAMGINLGIEVRY